MTFGRELVVLHTTPSMFSNFAVHAWEVVVWRFEHENIEGQSHFGMPRGAKTSLALNVPK